MQIAQHRQIFHGSGVSILQFPTSKNVVQVRVRKPFKDLSEAEINFSTAIVDSFIIVRSAHFSVKKAVCPIQSVNILLAFYQEQEDCYTENFQSEIVWLKIITAATMDGELSESVQPTISWTAHHASMQRSHSSTLPTINTKSPVVEHVSNDVYELYQPWTDHCWLF